VEPGHVRVTLGPQENRHRPAVDALFRTAAHAYGGRVVGVVLTGSGDDGTAGLGEIKRRGGLAVVQEPAEAFSPGMPQSALEFVPVDYRLPLKEIAPLLSRLARGEAVPADPSPVLRPEKGAPLMREAADGRSSPLREVLADPQEPTVPGPRDGFSCPQCNGHLWDMEEGGFLRFRCRVGHTFTVESLLAGKQENLEFTLWAAVNTFQESAALSRRMVDRLQRAGHHLAARRLLRRAEEAEGHARLLRELLGSGAFVSPLTADLEEFGDADLERAV